MANSKLELLKKKYTTTNEKENEKNKQGTVVNSVVESGKQNESSASSGNSKLDELKKKYSKPSSTRESSAYEERQAANEKREDARTKRNSVLEKSGWGSFENNMKTREKLYHYDEIDGLISEMDELANKPYSFDNERKWNENYEKVLQLTEDANNTRQKFTKHTLDYNINKYRSERNDYIKAAQSGRNHARGIYSFGEDAKSVTKDEYDAIGRELSEKVRTGTATDDDYRRYVDAEANFGKSLQDSFNNAIDNSPAYHVSSVVDRWDKYGIPESEIWKDEEAYKADADKLGKAYNEAFEKYAKGELSEAELTALGEEYKQFKAKEEVFFSPRWQNVGTTKDTKTLELERDNAAKAIDEAPEVFVPDKAGEHSFLGGHFETDDKYQKPYDEASARYQSALDYEQLEKEAKESQKKIDEYKKSGFVLEPGELSGIRFPDDPNDKLGASIPAVPNKVKYSDVDGYLDALFLTMYTDINTPGAYELMTIADYGTEDEKATYVWLRETKGASEADKYAKGLALTLGIRAKEKSAEEYKNASNFERFFMGAGSAFVAGLYGDNRYALEGIINTITRDTSYTPANVYQQVNAGHMSAEDNGIAKTAMQAVRSSSAQLPSMAAGLMGAGKLATALFTARSYGSARNDAINQGYSELEADGYALVSAGLEYASERMFDVAGIYGGTSLDDAVKASISKAIGNSVKLGSKTKTVLSTLAYLGLNGAGESIEEGIVEYATPHARNFILGERNAVLDSEHRGEIGNAMLVGLVSAYISPASISVVADARANTAVWNVINGNNVTESQLDQIINNKDARSAFEKYMGYKLAANNDIAKAELKAVNSAVAGVRGKDGVGSYNYLDGFNISADSVMEYTEAVSDLLPDYDAEYVKAESERINEVLKEITPDKLAAARVIDGTASSADVNAVAKNAEAKAFFATQTGVQLSDVPSEARSQMRTFVAAKAEASQSAGEGVKNEHGFTFNKDGTVTLPTAEDEWDAALKRSEAETLLYLKKLDASVLADGGVSTTELSDLLKDKNTARSIFVEYSKSHFPSSITNLETGHEIGISRNGIDKFLSGNISKEKYATGLKIPQLVESAHKVAEADNKKGKAGISGYEYYENKIKVDGNDYNVYIRVRNTDMGDRYYGHTIGKAVEDIKIEPSAWNSDGDTSVHSINALDSNSIISQDTPGVKIEKDGSIMLPTAEELDSDKVRLDAESGNVTTETTEFTGRECGVSEENIGIAVRLSHALGVKVAFYKDLTSDERGYYDNSTGVIWVNSKYQDVFSNVFGHELTHRIEKSRFYAKLAAFVEKRLKADGKDMNVLIIEKQNSYSLRGKILSQNEARHEVVAKYVGEVLLNNEADIADITKSDRGLGSFIMSKVDELVSMITGKNKEAVYIRKVQQMFRKALNDVSMNEARSAVSEGTTGNIHGDVNINGLAEAFRNGEISQSEYLEAYNRYMDEHPELDNEADFEGRQFDLDDESFSNQINDWLEGNGKKYGTYNGEYFDLGTTPNILVKHGAVNKKIIMTEECLNKITGQKHSISLDEVAKIPTQLNDPILLFKGSVPKSFVALTELKDKNGFDVIVAVHINTVHGNMVVNRVSSAYSKTYEDDNRAILKNTIVNYVNKQIEEGNLLDASTKKAPIWFTTKGLQLPNVVQTIIDANNSISQNNGFVNTQNKNISGTPTNKKAPDTSKQFHIEPKKNRNRQYDFDDSNDFADDMLYNSSFAAEMDAEEKLKKDSAKFERYNRWRNDKDAYNARGLAGESWWNKNRNKADRLFNKRELERLSKIKTELENSDELTVEQVTSLWGELRTLQRNVTAMSMAHQITNEELTQVTDLLRGDRTIEDVENLPSDRYNIDGILAVAKARLEYENVASQLREFNARRKARLNEAADGYINSADFKDKRGPASGLRYRRETMERNVRDIVKDKAVSDGIISEYFSPVHKNEADSTRYKEKLRNRVRELKISTKKEKGNKVSEAYAVQFYGEVADNIAYLEKNHGMVKYREGKSLDEWRELEAELWKENPGLDKEKITKAVEEFRKIYDELYQKLNEVRVKNGYEPVKYRRGYFPHFTPGTSDGVLAKIAKGLGIKSEVTDLPTTINGLTHTFKPGIKWMGNILERTGFVTEYDALEGFDRYLEAASDVIHHTDDIQRLRAFSSRIRYNASDDGIKKRADAISKNEQLSEDEKQSALEGLYKDGKFTGSSFAVALDDYINVLAGKKQISDRDAEYNLGRKMYDVVKGLESRVAANMIAGNLASALTNFIPITQAASVIRLDHVLHGAFNTVLGKDGMQDMSDFLVNRRGSDLLSMDSVEKASKILSKPMELIDTFASGTIVRARYYDNIRRGLSEDAALEEADSFAASVMADRSKGAMPVLFEQKNPLMKLFTQFQLEVNNQLSFATKDLWRDESEKAKQGKNFITSNTGFRYAVALLRFALFAFLFDELYEWLIGRRPALDPIGMLKDYAEDAGEDGWFKALGGLGEDVLENTPFIGGLMGGGRVPISSALPDVGKIYTSLSGNSDGEKKSAVVKKELLKPLYYLAPPFGGGAIKKLNEGIGAINKGGSYTVDTDGNEVLQYPVYNDTVGGAIMNGAGAVLFGKTTTSGGRKWVEDGFKNFTADYTEAYKGMIELDGVTQKEAYEFLDGLRNVKDPKKGDDVSVNDLKRQYIEESSIDDAAKGIAFYYSLANDKEKEFLYTYRDSEDFGAISGVLMGMKEHGNSVQPKRELLLESELETDVKRDIYESIIVSSDDKEKESAKIDAFEDAGMTVDDYLSCRNKKYELDNDDGLNASGRATEFARWVDNNFKPKQADIIKKNVKFSSGFSVSADNYEKYREAGLSPDEAYNLINGFGELEPEDGKEQVSDWQKARVIVDGDLSDEDKLTSLGVVLSSGTYERVSTAYDKGISFERYFDVKDEYDSRKANYTADEKDSYADRWNSSHGRTSGKTKLTFNQIMMYEAIEGIGGDLTLSAGGITTAPKYYFTKHDKAVLWQILDGEWSHEKNPFDTSVGLDVRKSMGWVD